MFHILVADDDQKTANFFRTSLESEGYTVSVAKNGEAALKIIDKEYIDLVVLDTVMPKMDGFEFTKTLRDVNNNMPILMVSPRHKREDVIRGFNVGTDDFMTKPVDIEEMILRIKALLRRAKIADEHKIVIGDVVLDYDCLSVTKGKNEQILAQKEFMLLYKLLSYPGKIFTRIQLMDEIWGSESSTGWETVTVHIGRLRKRFENWNEFQIQSVRGVGYRAIKNVH